MSKLLLVDARNLLWRAESTMGALTNASGKPTGALHGFLTILLRVAGEFRPDRVVICWDDWKRGPRVRKAIYPLYKSGRQNEEVTEERKLAYERVREQQFDLVKLFKHLNVSQARSPGWEADDVMATLARKWKGTAYIFTGDRDLLQCVTRSPLDARSHAVHVLRPTGEGAVDTYHASRVFDEFGVTVSQFADYKALVGDSSDGYPGCPGIGPKTAVALLRDFGSLKAILAAPAPALSLTPKLKEKLDTNLDLVKACAEIAKVNDDAPLKYIRRRPDSKKALGLLGAWQLRQVLTHIGKLRRLGGHT